MPTPIELLLDMVSITIMAMYLGLMLWEAFFPARKLPEIPYWKIKGLVAFVVFFFLSSYLPLLWDKHLIQYQLFDLSRVGTAGGVIIGYLLYEFASYVWHRSMHHFDVLWKGVHQMHHSVERLDAYSAFWFSPLDMVGWTFLGSLVLTLGVGINPQAVTIFLLMSTFFAIFTHSNIRTPHWLGYLIQRPESHRLHHGKNIHGMNYSTLPLYDMLFGTFVNPRFSVKETGFYDGASSRILDMLIFRDVNEPAKPAA